MNNSEEQEINLVDLFLEVLSHYKAILIVSIVLMLLAASYGYYKQYNEDSVDKDTKIQLALDNIELTLDEEHLKDVYYSYKDVYETQKEKNMENPAMSANPENVMYCNLTYIISGAFNSDMIGNAYTTKIPVKEESFGCLYKLCGAGVSPSQININISGSMDEKMAPETQLRFVVYGIDAEDCQKNVDNIKSMVEAVTPEIQSAFKKYQITMINDTLVQAEPEVLRDYQNGETQKEYQAYSALNGIKNAMPDDVKTYITTVADFEKEENHSLVMTFVKYALIGFVAGAFIMACVYAVEYILNKKLRFEDDFEGIYSLPVLGRAASESANKGLNKKIQNVRRRNIHIFSNEEVVDMIVAGIKVKCQKDGIGRVYITGSCMSNKEKLLMNNVAGKLSGIEVIIGKPMLYFADALEASAKAGSVVLIEKAGESGYLEISKEITACKEQNINILGAVIVE